jgi:glutamate 5-kinase
MNQLRRMVVKVGSQVVCEPQGGLSRPALCGLVRQIAGLRSSGWEVVLVSSGAVAAAANLPLAARLDNPVTRRQVLAAVGQVRLMETYRQLFDEHQLSIAQVLASKSDFQSRGHYLNMRGCIEGLLAAGLVPVANENDVVSVTELMFTDNDELAGLLAGMLGASQLCLLSSVPGVLDANGRVIGQWHDAEHDIDTLLQAGTSQLGRGGMHNKLDIARRTAGLGVEVVIADGRSEDVLERIAAGEIAGTHFAASSSATPPRRWLASMEGHALGSVTINAGAEQALTDPTRMASLLPVGVEALDGEFQRGDVIEVRAADGRVLGCGRSQYDHQAAREALGQRTRKPIIHYDYLYLSRLQ